MQPQPSLLRPLIISGALFFLLGFFTWINGPLITFVKLAFDLDDVGSFLILMVFYLSYLAFALPAAWILRRTGLKKGISLALVIMAVGAAAFGYFATHRDYPATLTGLFTIGSGMALLQTAVNPYISILGSIDTAARRIAMMGICNKFAGIVAPIMLGQFVLQGIGGLASRVEAAAPPEKEALLAGFAANILAPYLVLAGVLLVSAYAILKSSLPEIKASELNSGAEGTDSNGSLLAFPHLWLGVLCLFFCIGTEVMAGDAIGTYGEGFGLPLDQTKFFTSLTLAAMLAGYIAGLAVIPRFISQEAYLGVSAGLGIAFTIGAWLTTGYVSVGCVAALGFANAMMWPAIFPMAIRGLGRFTETGSALLIMGIAGGAIIPQLFAILKQSYNFQTVFIMLMLPCYLYILFFAVKGHKARPRIVAREAAA